MIPYEVRDRAGDSRFYVLAASAEQAIERVGGDTVLGGPDAG